MSEQFNFTFDSGSSFLEIDGHRIRGLIRGTLTLDLSEAFLTSESHSDPIAPVEPKAEPKAEPEQPRDTEEYGPPFYYHPPGYNGPWGGTAGRPPGYVFRECQY